VLRGLRWIAIRLLGVASLTVETLLFPLLRTIHHPSADIVRRYYGAIVDREYAIAFSCLSARPAAPTSRLTLDSLTEQIRTAEAADGLVTGYALVNFAMSATDLTLRMKVASYTVEVAQTGRAWKAYPRLHLEADGWRIVQFDRSQLDLR
jgi:hypothetical protein